MSKPVQNHLKVEVQDPNYSNLDDLLQLIQSAFAYMQGRIDPPSSMRLLTAETLAQKCRDETLLTVSDAHKLVGCAIAKEYDDCVYVGKVATAQSHRGCGIAKTLIDHCKSLARLRGKPVLEIQVRVELIENQAYFEKLGFVKCGETAHAGYSRPTSYTYRLNCT